MSRLLILNRLPWYGRLPCKWVAFGLVAFVVCNPHLTLFIRHVQHWRNPNALIEPEAPALQPLVEEVRPRISPDMPPTTVLKTVEGYVLQRIPYSWDWDNWGNADYLPTVAETLEKGREDCDGRAVIAASLLRKLGVDAKLVTDLAHVWVTTPLGETMGPGRTAAVVATDQGLQIQLGALCELPRALAYGVAVFPAIREFIIIAAAWFLMLHARSGPWKSLLALAVMAGGLLLLRRGGADYRHPLLGAQFGGFTALGIGICTLLYRSNRKTEQPPQAPLPVAPE